MKFLSKKIVKQLSKKKLKISVAESCTGGMLSNIITSNAGSSKIFNLGLITYSNKSKIDILRIPANIIRKYGSVSKHVSFAMVKNLSKISKSDINVSITGISGPSGDGIPFQKIRFSQKRISLDSSVWNQFVHPALHKQP